MKLPSLNHFLTISFLLIFSFSLILPTACKKDKEIVTETIVVKDTVLLTDYVYLSDTTSTFILIRHAETAGGGSDPNLSTEGQNRSEALNKTLSDVDLSTIYSTNYNRTRQTAESVAKAKSLQIQYYDPSLLDNFADSCILKHKNQAILIVGHSNTTPSLLNILIGENKYANLPESEYNNLFIVTVYTKGHSKVIHLKYGE